MITSKNLLGKRFGLCFLPTPLHPLKNLSKRYSDYQLFIKRDDLTGLATGGNKARKLEFFIHDALRAECDTVITAGAQQSNHCRQTAAACSVAGLECHLMLGGEEPKIYEGNLLLSHLLGAHIRFTGGHRKGEDLPEMKSRLERQHKKCWVIPYGGSDAIGALGYVNAVAELQEQMSRQSVRFDYIFFACSSGGTQAGLLLGAELFGLTARLMPVSIDKENTHGRTLEENVLAIVQDASRALGLKRTFTIQDINLIRGYDSAGYGNVTEEEIIAMKLLAGTEGILLDPVYTGRAFHAMLDYLDTGKVRPHSSILFLHTGGLPSLFNSGASLREPESKPGPLTSSQR